MNAPADPPERIAEILREILTLSQNEETSVGNPVETVERLPSNQPDPELGDGKANGDKTVNG